MDSISPLAKILAEANGIDWRSIHGSGAGGSIVEQDILNYLSRVMSGDEEPPATPVDEIPEGWTGEMPPMPVNMSGLEALKAAGVESDITDFVDQQAQAVPQAAPAAPEPVVASAEMPAAELDDAPEFEIAEPEQDAALPAHAAVAEAGELDEADFELEDPEEDDLELADPVQAEPVQAEPVYAEPVHTPEPVHVAEPELQPVQAAFDPAPVDHEAEYVLAGSSPAELAQAEAAPPVPDQTAAVAASGASGFGLGGFLSRLYGSKPAEPAAPEAPAQLPVQPPVQPSVPAAPETTIGAAHDEASVPAVHELPAEPVLGEPLIPQAPPIPDTPVAAPLVADQWRDQEAAPVVAEAVGAPVLELEQPTELPEAHEADPEPLPQDSVSPAATAAADLPAQPVNEAQPEAEAAPVAVPAAMSAPVSAASLQLPTMRLNADLSALETARTQLSEALFREVPLSLLVGRAAARSIGTLGLGGTVALGNHAGQALATDLSGDFRASLDALKQTTDSPADLLVLDASELGLDELHRGERSLSVGRTGESGVVLSLRGDLDPVHGAQFLREIAELLKTPIRLLF